MRGTEKSERGDVDEMDEDREKRRERAKINTETGVRGDGDS